jgi:hypothetical protein
MLIGNDRLSVDSSTTVGRNFGRALLDGIGCSLNVLSFYLHNFNHPWWELGDCLLADIGMAPGDAEVEKLRHRPLIRAPRGF